MLNIIKGSSGTGKSTYIINLLAEMVKNGENKILFIVPDQSTFETEKTFLKLLGPMDSLKIKVLGFKRICDYIFSVNGNSGKVPLDDGGKAILMSLAIENCQDNIPLFSHTKNKRELINIMLSAVKEYKTCNITDSVISSAIESIDDETLKEKLTETLLIKNTFDSLVNQSNIDPDEYITYALNSILENNIFKDYIIAMDSFSGFTNLELMFLEKLITDCREFYISLTTDNNDDNELFFTTERTIRQLKKIAKDNLIKINTPTVLYEPVRFRNTDLVPILNNVYRVNKEQFCNTPNGLSVYESRNKHTECDFVARNIRKLIIEDKYSYNDIAVIYRNESAYEGIVDTVFEKYEIPYFMDKTEDIFLKPLIKLVVSVFDAINSSFSRESVLNILKSGLVIFKKEEIAEFENYIFVWNIRGSSFLKDFSENPRGFVPEFTDNDVKTLDSINHIRSSIINPLVKFRNESKDTSAEEITKNLYNLLIKLEVDKNLVKYCEYLETQGEYNLSDEQRRLWDILMKVLDKMILLIGEKQLSIREYSDLLFLQFNSGDIGYIPHSQDEVIVSGIERVRLPQKKAVFVLGCNEGEFPQNPTPSGIFTDLERKTLLLNGINVNDATDELNFKEMYLAYYALTLASEKLFVCYQSSDLKGDKKTASSIISELTEIYPNISYSSDLSLTTSDELWCESTAFQHMAKMIRTDSKTVNVLTEYFLDNQKYRDKVQYLKNIVDDEQMYIKDESISRKLFGENLKLSASQVESFHLCKFRYFCQYGLRAKERKTAEIDSLQYGTLMHYIFEKFFSQHEKSEYSTYDKQKVAEIVALLLDEYAENELGGLDNKSNRFRYLFYRMKDNAIELVYHIITELSQSEFNPVGFEMNVGDDLPCYELALEDGTTLRLYGSIDRVDLMKKDDVSYIRVVDYKTGHKEFKLSDILYGINLQMLIYLSAIAKNGKEKFGGEIVPCGVLYQPSSNKYVNADVDSTEEKILKKQNENLRMKGLVLDNPTIICAMEKTGESKYIPVGFSKNKVKGTEYATSLSELGSLFRKIDKLLIEMAENLHSGKIEYNPIKSKNRYDACAWCPYLSVCGYEEGKNCRKMVDNKKDVVMEIIREEENNAKVDGKSD